MHTYKYICLLVLPVLVIASNVHNEILAMSAISSFALEKRDNELVARQALGGLIGGLIGSIGPLLDLITPENFERIGTVLRNAASLLDDDMVKIIKELIKNANDLLTPEFVELVTNVINTLGPIIESIGQLIGAVISLLFGGSSTSTTPTVPSTDSPTPTDSSTDYTLPPFDFGLGGSDSGGDGSPTSSAYPSTPTSDLTLPTGGGSDISSGTDSGDGPVFTGAASSIHASMGAWSILVALAAAVLA